MTDFTVHGPVLKTIVGTAGDDRLTYYLDGGPGGMLLQMPTPNVGGGYDGVFLPNGGDPTHFLGIENISFIDRVGGDDTLTTAGGDDVLTGRGGRDMLSGGGGSDSLYGGSQQDALYGGDDGDYVAGGKGNDRLFGQSGHDSLFGDTGNDKIYGGDDNDFIDGGLGNDKLFGGRGDDFIIADQGADRVDAGNGKDQVEISFDTVKTVDGGAGHDMLMAFFEPEVPVAATLTFDMATGVFRSAEASISGSTAINFEDFAFQGEIDIKVLGTNGANQLFASAGDDILRGNGGSDALFGEAGNDKLVGGAKADTLNGGDGDDLLIGGSGWDMFIFAGGADTIADFKDDADTILILGGLVPFGTTVEDIVDSATVEAGNTIIDLGDGNVLTIAGLTDTSLLLNDLELG
ncbi:calcium-binding protein [Pseudodonghicola xiamenensis]|uniref:Hemolysin-type calcium-binding repeat-containing protein n=1 Tax=Pseudodonghicola xiamenensis TaxID=337702 RepID=A0A8J3H6J4_9RHOB|nr:calcium-binding protein [Pseudodonghicola xiamenensis]GHG84353.1 hypothetical protein GCM10010961_10310 [Pseudodonghicola xiamenensis]